MMKRILSILFASLILASGMHISIATHYCGGVIAASKVSFNEQKADCGMESGKNECPTHNNKQVNSDCCKNFVSVYSVDETYKISSLEFKQFTQNILQIIYTPFSLGLSSNLSSLSLITSVGPPINLLVKQVILSDICVFRI